MLGNTVIATPEEVDWKGALLPSSTQWVSDRGAEMNYSTYKQYIYTHSTPLRRQNGKIRVDKRELDRH